MRHGERTLRRLLKPLAEWMDHPATTELVVNRPGVVGVEQSNSDSHNDGWTWHDVPELTYDHLEALGILAGYARSKDISPHRPTVKSVLPDGQRITVCQPPAVPDGTVSLTIRKRAASFTPTLEWLAARGYFSHINPKIDWVDYFTRAVREPWRHRRIPATVVAGGAIGSSKTTFGEALIRAIPLDKRIITIEDTPEWLSLPHQNLVQLYYGEHGRRAVDCLQDALRMRPDWLLMQEMQDEQAWGFSRSLKIGHPGITTVHAATCAEVFDALEAQIRQSESGRTMDVEWVHEDLRKHLDIIVLCARGPYRLTEVVEVRDGELVKVS